MIFALAGIQSERRFQAMTTLLYIFDSKHLYVYVLFYFPYILIIVSQFLTATAENSCFGGIQGM